MSAQPIRSVDDIVAAYLDLTDRIFDLSCQQAALKNQLRDRGVGTYETAHGTTVTVSPPSRKFNQAKAWDLLSEEQRAVAVSPDAKKIKAQLAGVLVDACMEPGTGENVVRFS